jgi:hypothetical protein
MLRSRSSDSVAASDPTLRPATKPRGGTVLRHVRLFDDARLLVEPVFGLVRGPARSARMQRPRNVPARVRGGAAGTGAVRAGLSRRLCGIAVPGQDAVPHRPDLVPGHGRVRGSLDGTAGQVPRFRSFANVRGPMRMLASGGWSDPMIRILRRGAHEQGTKDWQPWICATSCNIFQLLTVDQHTYSSAIPCRSVWRQGTSHARKLTGKSSMLRRLNQRIGN